MQRNAARGHQVGMTAMSHRPDLLTVEEAAAWLRIGRTCAYQLCRRYLATNGAEGIPCIRVGRSAPPPRVIVGAAVRNHRDRVPQIDDLHGRSDNRRGRSTRSSSRSSALRRHRSAVLAGAAGSAVAAVPEVGDHVPPFIDLQIFDPI